MTDTRYIKMTVLSRQFGVDRKTVKAWCDDNSIEYIMIGKSFLAHEAQFMKFIKDNTVNPQEKRGPGRPRMMVTV